MLQKLKLRLHEQPEKDHVPASFRAFVQLKEPLTHGTFPANRRKPCKKQLCVLKGIRHSGDNSRPIKRHPNYDHLSEPITLTNGGRICRNESN